MAMRYNYKTTGPFKLLSIDTENPRYLLLNFDDINPSTGQPSQRKMAKGGNWPSYFAEKLFEKATPLINSQVYVKTSQTTKLWPTHEWLCDVEAAQINEIKTRFAEKLKAADGISNLDESLVLDSHMNIIDHSLAKDHCTTEQEYEIFWKNLADNFKASWVNSKARTLDDNVKRIRVKGAERLSKRNGYRAVIWRAFEINSVNYFVVLRVDRKLDREDFLSNDEIKEIKSKVDNLADLYDPTKMRQVIEEIFT